MFEFGDDFIVFGINPFSGQHMVGYFAKAIGEFVVLVDRDTTDFNIMLDSKFQKHTEQHSDAVIVFAELMVMLKFCPNVQNPLQFGRRGDAVLKVCAYQPV